MYDPGGIYISWDGRTVVEIRRKYGKLLVFSSLCDGDYRITTFSLSNGRITKKSIIYLVLSSKFTSKLKNNYTYFTPLAV